MHLYQCSRKVLDHESKTALVLHLPLKIFTPVISYHTNSFHFISYYQSSFFTLDGCPLLDIMVQNFCCLYGIDVWMCVPFNTVQPLVWQRAPLLSKHLSPALDRRWGGPTQSCNVPPILTVLRGTCVCTWILQSTPVQVMFKGLKLWLNATEISTWHILPC